MKVVVVVAATIALLAAAVVRIPGTLALGLAFERGQRAEQRGDFSTAVARYQVVAESFPQSTTALARLGIAQFRAGQLASAETTLAKLAGHKTEKLLATEVNGVIEQLRAARKNR
jgi:Flp pilus assembly protein TadD